MALAPLGFTIDTSPVAKAVADLGHLTTATTKAQQEVAKVFRVDNFASQYAQKIDNSARALRGFEAIAAKAAATAKHVTDQMQRMTAHEMRNVDIQAYGAELDALRTKFNPVFAASKQYEAEVTLLSDAHAVGAITTREHDQALVGINARYQAAADGANRFAREIRIAAAQQQADIARAAQTQINQQLGVRADFGGAARNSEIAAYGAEMDRLRAKFDPLVAAQQRHVAAIEEINRANQVGAISASTAMQARIRETSAYQAQISVLHNLAAAQKASAQGMVDRVTITPDRGADIAAYGAELDRLRAKFSPVFAASKRYEQELNELNRAHKIGAINTAEHGTALVALNGRYQAAGTATAAFGAQTRMAQQHARNLAFQFQDIGTMLAMGQSPFMLLAQQLPQVTMYGGRLTGVMGALKQTVSGLFSPLGLLTTGFVLAGSAAISYFSSTSDEADKAAEILQDQESLIERVADRWGETIPALREYADAIKAAREAADLQSASQIVQNSHLDEVRRLLPEVNAELSRFGQLAGGGGWGSALEDDAAAVADAFDDVTSALAVAAKAVEDGEDATDALKEANDALARLLNGNTIPAVGGLSGALGTLTEAYGAATAAAQEFNRQQAVAAAQEANRGRLDMAGQRLSQDGTDPLGDNEFLSRFGWDNDVINFPREKKLKKGRKTDAERSAERYDDMIRQSQQFIAAQELEQRALSMTEKAAAALRYEQEMLNQVANDNIRLTPEMSREIESLAGQMASAEAATNALRSAQEAFDDAAHSVGDGLRSIFDGTKDIKDAMIDLIPVVLKLLNTMNMAEGGRGIFGGGMFQSLVGGLLGVGFSGGGHTGGGSDNQVKGFVHANEYVMSAPATRAIGVGNLDAMHNAARSGISPVSRAHAPANDRPIQIVVESRNEIVSRFDADGGFESAVERTSRPIAKTESAAAAGKVASAGPSMADARADERQFRRVRPGGI